MNRFLFNFFYLKTSISIQRYNIKVKRSIFISRILRNTFPVKFYYHFSLVNWTSSEHAHCAWYEMLIINKLESSVGCCRDQGWMKYNGFVFHSI